MALSRRLPAEGEQKSECHRHFKGHRPPGRYLGQGGKTGRQCWQRQRGIAFNPTRQSLTTPFDLRLAQAAHVSRSRRGTCYQEQVAQRSCRGQQDIQGPPGRLRPAALPDGQGKEEPSEEHPLLQR